MQTKQHILFIVNPISGVGKQKLVESMVDRYLDASKFNADFAYTEYAGHAREPAKDAASRYASIIAVGGDGTINETASGLLGTDCSLGAVPTGSGNGFARHMRIPVNVQKAVQMLNTAQPMTIDTASINGRCFVNVSGIGFDAEVGHQFANYGRRGPLAYVNISARAYRQYRAQHYTIDIDGRRISVEAFAMSFANTTQFGNNAHIAPTASVQDGLIDLSIIQRFPLAAALPMAVKLFNKTLDRSRFFTSYKCKRIKIHNSGSVKMHIDGEPEIMTGDINIQIHPLSLRVLCAPGQERNIQ